MKIFAKRTRTVVDPETAERLRREQKEREAEKAVQELLKLDPSELNSKQRRLVKRYKERDKSGEKQSSEDQNDSGVDDVHNPAETPNHKGADVAKGESSSDSNDSDNSAADESSELLKEAKDGSGGEAVGESTVKVDADDTAAANNDLGEVEVKKLLEKLNSKQRRKLMRRLEREGNNILANVREEAVQLLKESDAEKVVTTETPETKTETKSPTALSGRKRKKDWSDLPPEERLRREEQRRLQQEAAERRTKEGNPGNERHPLNSERRRANRRKPKWEGKRRVEQNEHNTSGFHMRKLKKAG